MNKLQNASDIGSKNELLEKLKQYEKDGFTRLGSPDSPFPHGSTLNILINGYRTVELRDDVTGKLSLLVLYNVDGEVDGKTVNGTVLCNDNENGIFDIDSEHTIEVVKDSRGRWVNNFVANATQETPKSERVMANANTPGQTGARQRRNS